MTATSDIVYGRQGGRLVDPATPDLTDGQRKRKDPADRWCRLCLDLGRNVKLADHPTDICQACGGYLCHHQGDDEALCWEGRARCAAAKRATGAELNRTEVEALTRHPSPPQLTAEGYLDTGFFKKAVC